MMTSSTRGRAEHPHGARRRLLEGLEQGVGGALGEPVGVLDDDDPPPADRRAVGRERDEVAGLLDLDRQPLGRDDVDVGVGAVERGAALAALAAAAVAGTAAPRRRRGPRPSGPTRADR